MESLNPAVFEILRSKRVGVTSLTFKVTWRHQSRDGISHVTIR